MYMQKYTSRRPSIVIGNRGMCECSLRLTRKPECVALQTKSSVALVQIKKRPGSAHDEEVLKPFVLEIGKNRAGGVVEHAKAGSFCHVFKGAVPTVVK